MGVLSVLSLVIVAFVVGLKCDAGTNEDLRNQLLSLANTLDALTRTQPSENRSTGPHMELENRVLDLENRISALLKYAQRRKVEAEVERGNIEDQLDSMNQTMYQYNERLINFQNKAGAHVWKLQNNVTDTSVKVSQLQGTISNRLSELSEEIEQVRNISEVKQPTVEGAIFYGGFGSSCAGSDECISPQSVCRDGRCQCQVGLSFNKAKRECLSSCESYGTTFQTIPKFAIKLHNDLIAVNQTELECKQLCIDTVDFVCRSLDYFPRYRKCYLSSITKTDVPIESWDRNIISVHYQRDCE